MSIYKKMIKDILIKNNWSMRKFAEELNVNPATPYLWKNGGLKPNKTHRKAIKKLLENSLPVEEQAGIFRPEGHFLTATEATLNKYKSLDSASELLELMSSNISAMLKVKLARLLLK